MALTSEKQEDAGKAMRAKVLEKQRKKRAEKQQREAESKNKKDLTKKHPKEGRIAAPRIKVTTKVGPNPRLGKKSRVQMMGKSARKSKSVKRRYRPVSKVALSRLRRKCEKTVKRTFFSKWRAETRRWRDLRSFSRLHVCQQKVAVWRETRRYTTLSRLFLKWFVFSQSQKAKRERLQRAQRHHRKQARLKCMQRAVSTWRRSVLVAREIERRAAAHADWVLLSSSWRRWTTNVRQALIKRAEEDLARHMQLLRRRLAIATQMGRLNVLGRIMRRWGTFAETCAVARKMRLERKQRRQRLESLVQASVSRTAEAIPSGFLPKAERRLRVRIKMRHQNLSSNGDWEWRKSPGSSRQWRSGLRWPRPKEWKGGRGTAKRKRD